MTHEVRLGYVIIPTVFLKASLSFLWLPPVQVIKKLCKMVMGKTQERATMSPFMVLLVNNRNNSSDNLRGVTAETQHSNYFR